MSSTKQPGRSSAKQARSGQRSTKPSTGDLNFETVLHVKQKTVKNSENYEDVKPQKYLCEAKCSAGRHPRRRHRGSSQEAFRRCFFKHKDQQLWPDGRA